MAGLWNFSFEVDYSRMAVKGQIRLIEACQGKFYSEFLSNIHFRPKAEQLELPYSFGMGEKQKFTKPKFS